MKTRPVAPVTMLNARLSSLESLEGHCGGSSGSAGPGDTLQANVDGPLLTIRPPGDDTPNTSKLADALLELFGSLDVSTEVCKLVVNTIGTTSPKFPPVRMKSYCSAAIATAALRSPSSRSTALTDADNKTRGWMAMSTNECPLISQLAGPTGNVPPVCSVTKPPTTRWQTASPPPPGTWARAG